MKIIILLAVVVTALASVCVLGQGVAAPYTARLQPRVTGLTQPVLIRHAGDGSKRLFIVEQTGMIKVLQPGASIPTPFIDLSSKIIAGGERGLLGMTFNPQFAT